MQIWRIKLISSGKVKIEISGFKLQSISLHICHRFIEQRHSNLSQRYCMQFPLNTHQSFKIYPLIGNDISRVFLIREKECGSLFAISTLLSFLWQHITLSDMWLANEGKKATSVKNLQNRSFLDTKKTSNMFIVYVVSGNILLLQT